MELRSTWPTRIVEQGAVLLDVVLEHVGRLSNRALACRRASACVGRVEAVDVARSVAGNRMP